MTLSDIIMKLESATEGSWELDAEITAAVFDGAAYLRNAPGFVEIDGGSYLCVHYTTRLDVKIPGEDIIQVSEQNAKPGAHRFWVAIHRPLASGRYLTSGHGYNEILARRICALKARKGNTHG